MAQYADIVGIDAPGSAPVGSQVDIAIKVKNTYSAPIGIKVSAQLEYADMGPPPTWHVVFFEEDVANVDAGVTHSFRGYFVMPSSQTTIHAYSYWYGADGQWHYDDYMTRTVNIGEVEEMFSDFAIIGLNKV